MQNRFSGQAVQPGDQIVAAFLQMDIPDFKSFRHAPCRFEPVDSSIFAPNFVDQPRGQGLTTGKDPTI